MNGGKWQREWAYFLSSRACLLIPSHSRRGRGKETPGPGGQLGAGKSLPSGQETSSASLSHRLMDLAKEMTKEALPIKCLEAVILGMYPSSSLGESCLEWLSLGCLLWNGSVPRPPGLSGVSISWSPAWSSLPRRRRKLCKREDSWGGHRLSASSCYLARPAV